MMGLLPYSVKLTLPYPPTVNTYWRRVGPKTLISKRGREYRASLESLAMTMDRSQWPMTEPLRVAVFLYPPDKRRRDIDNVLKALLDGIGHMGVYQDDSQILRLEVTKMHSGKGEVVVVIENMCL
jgi:Holliday junction resolvase RusA-like endonuclease